MKKIYILILLVGISLRCSAQLEPANFFKGLFNTIKNADIAAFANSFLSQQQFKILVMAQFKIEAVNQDSLDNAPGISAADQAYRAAITKGFSKFIQSLDSLRVDRAGMQFLDFSYQQAKDTSVLCTSLKGAVYFRSGDKYYQWNVGEAVLVKGAWKLMDAGKIDDLKDHAFLTSAPQRATVFNTMNVTVKIKPVVLQPPPPINKQPPPPPPPEPPKPKKKKSGN